MHPIDCKAFLGLCSLLGQVPFAEREAPKSLKEGCFEGNAMNTGFVLRKRVVSLEAKWEYHSLPFQQLSIAFPIFPIMFCSIFRVCVTLPDRIEDFDIKNTESQCCITGHRDPVSETPVMCDREILLQCINWMVLAVLSRLAAHHQPTNLVGLREGYRLGAIHAFVYFRSLPIVCRVVSSFSPPVAPLREFWGRGAIKGQYCLSQRPWKCSLKLATYRSGAGIQKISTKRSNRLPPSYQRF